MGLNITVNKKMFTDAVERVFKDLVLGLSYEEISAAHDIKKETVKSHAKVIRETFNENSIRKITAKVIAKGIVTISETGGKTMFAISLIMLSGVIDDHHMYRGKTKVKTKIERRIDEV